ncbi:MAG TPA: biopolymer transporter ExbD [Polyangiaceae bacterium]
MTLIADRRAERLRALRTLLPRNGSAPLPEVKSDINVTPLVDVVLVLLIIFMVVTPLIASGVVVNLPRTKHHSLKPDEGKDIIISVTRDNQLYLGSARLARPEELAAAVRAARQRFPDKSIFLKGDTLASYGSVREVMQLLREMDIDDVVLGTEELKGP